jgi:fructokinase
MSTPRFVVAGEALVDIVVPVEGETEEAPGGSPLNVAVGLSRLGLDTVLVTELGDDERGRLVAEHVRGAGVVLDEASVVPGHRTSTATAHLDTQHAATYDFDLSWTLSARRLTEDATGLHVGSIGVTLRPGRDVVAALVAQAADRGLLVTYDPNARPALTTDVDQAWRDVTEVAASSRLVKMSDEDVRFLQPGRTHAEVAADLLSSGTDLVVVTSGGGGAEAYTRGDSVTVPSRSTRVVDTVGAGDSFMAALVALAVEHGLDDLRPERLTTYLHAAHEAAAVTVSRRGANPPTRAELEGWPEVL